MTPALVLLDIELPGIDGFETLKRLRQQLPRLLAICCSAHVTGCNCGEFDTLLTGCDCVLCKPVRFQAIAKAVAAALMSSAKNPATDDSDLE
ncbi:MAG: hypothetical protein B7Z55_17095 [Planctomycetales bacterium 12-60-4]|nr:MAG: hypothetical protein B7Z55_17095 [Planctomycetales bacterium 12-60-4]